MPKRSRTTPPVRVAVDGVKVDVQDRSLLSARSDSMSRSELSRAIYWYLEESGACALEREPTVRCDASLPEFKEWEKAPQTREPPSGLLWLLDDTVCQISEMLGVDSSPIHTLTGFIQRTVTKGIAPVSEAEGYDEVHGRGVSTLHRLHMILSLPSAGLGDSDESSTDDSAEVAPADIVANLEEWLSHAKARPAYRWLLEAQEILQQLQQLRTYLEYHGREKLAARLDDSVQALAGAWGEWGCAMAEPEKPLERTRDPELDLVNAVFLKTNLQKAMSEVEGCIQVLKPLLLGLGAQIAGPVAFADSKRVDDGENPWNPDAPDQKRLAAIVAEYDGHQLDKANVIRLRNKHGIPLYDKLRRFIHAHHIPHMHNPRNNVMVLFGKPFAKAVREHGKDLAEPGPTPELVANVREALDGTLPVWTCEDCGYAERAKDEPMQCPGCGKVGAMARERRET